MNRPDHELDELLGAYALDAVDAEERLEIEQYLRRSPRAMAEVREHHEVAAVLAGAFTAAREGQVAGTAAPAAGAAQVEPELWSRIALRLGPPADTASAFERDQGRRAGDGSGVVLALAAARRRERLRRWVAPVVAAACVAAVFGVATVRQNQRIDQLERELALENTDSRVVEELISRSGTSVVTLSSPDNRLSARVVLASDGRGYLLGGDLPVLRNGMTYQLWGVKGSTVVSLGVFGRHPVRVPFAADDRWSQLVLTAEATPGVAASQQPAIVAGPVV